MKFEIACFLFVTAMTTVILGAPLAYFYDDKQFSDIIKANSKFVSEWVAFPESKIPPKLKPLIVTRGDVDGKEIFLVPFNALLFNDDETFTYLWGINDSSTGEISGKWRVENSTLIFTLGKEYSSVYKKGSELRYKVSKTPHSDTTLRYSGTNYPKVQGIIKTTDNPLKDFATIVVSIEREKVRALCTTNR